MQKKITVALTLVSSLVTVALVSVFDDSNTTKREMLRSSAPEQVDLFEDDETLGSKTVSYQSDTFGYKLSYPSTWHLDDSRKEVGVDVLSDPKGHVVITLSETEDIEATSPKGMAHIYDSLKESLRFDSSFDLTEIERLIWKSYPTIYVEGKRMVGNKHYNVSEYHIVRKEHSGILNISITMQDGTEELYEDIVTRILQSMDACPEQF